ncbi:CotY/CotZ family spore coat protein [Aciduricibacillus chroicocephali]|uniref:CotY/CotZ family spore coat protein n=1 Tax=Aciduricibacillus chroicocephali TaxID=3054939 RepID=A0ABY9L153_9BACI|nr:CotY/CotZ family spore coat protein [Bacillaceae bacterium 44XB]
MTNKEYCHEQCVCRTVRKIIEAQDKVTKRNKHCSTGCEKSIRDLLKTSRPSRNEATTIPFVLYCKGTCKPFIVETIEHASMKCFDQKWYRCVKSPFLKAKKIILGSKCCAVVEILLPCNANGMSLHNKGNELSEFLCEKSPFKTIRFRETGICMTVDLEDFTAIRCLAATKPLPPESTSFHDMSSV